MMLISKTIAILLLVGSFAWDLFASTWAVARIVLSPRMHTEPAIIAMPVAVRKPWAVAMLAYFTSLTPGSTCLHVSQDRTKLYLHILDMKSRDQTIAKFQRLYESRIEVLER